MDPNPEPRAGASGPVPQLQEEDEERPPVAGRAVLL